MAELIVTMLLLLAVSRGLGEVFERMRQSPVVGEVLAGIILGPYVLRMAVLDADGINALQAVADLGVFLLVFLAGLEMDIEEIADSVRGRGVFVGALGFLLPFLAGVGLGIFAGLPLEGALFLGLALGLTALPVSVRILMDLGLTEHSIGKVIISAAIFTEVVTLTLLGVLIAFQDQTPTSFEEGMFLGSITVLKTFLLFSIVLTVVQVFRLTSGVVPGAQRTFRRALGVLRGRESLFALAILFVLTFAGVSQILGLHFVVGAFFGGLLLSGRLLGDYNYKQVYKTTSAITFGFLAPIFFGFIGLQFVPDAILVEPLLAVLVLGVGFAAKLGAGYIGARAAGRGGAEGVAVGLGLTIHGVLELVVANLALQLGIFTPELFSIVVLLSIVSTILAPPLLRWAMGRIPPEAAAVPGGAAAAPPRAAPGLQPEVLPAPEAPVIIVGGGRVAVELARAIGPCTILERDGEQARAITAVLDEARVIIGSASVEEDLRRAGVRAGAVVLAVTDEDEANEFVVRFARKQGARRVIARTEQTGEVERLRQMGADAVLNSAEETASAILLELYPPDATMAEIIVPKGSPAVGKHLMELKLPRGTVVRSVSRRARVHVPTPDLIIEPRDDVIVSGSPSGLQAARDILLGPRSGGESVNVLAAMPEDLEAARVLAQEVGVIASHSRGALIAAVPWESPSGPFAPAVEAAFRKAGVEAEVARGYTLTPADIQDALASARTPPPQDESTGRSVSEDGDVDAVLAEPLAGEAPGQEFWMVALPHQAIGKGDGQIPPRRLPNLPTSIGAPVYVARAGRPARTVTALIDGAEGADRAGTLACDIARILNARLVLLVVRFEDEPEPLEQAAYIEAYARNAGLGTIERLEVDHPSAPAVERQLRKAPDLVVMPAVPRAVRGRFLSQLASTGDHSVLLV
jgi:Kef-type K+ transport system membrane component KefB/Trk K+ transport system NAD-binding subunit